jgi:hypothetical protein
MLSEITAAYLSTLTYRADAERRVCWLPLSGIYWEDELPDIEHLRTIPQDDFTQILRLFGIRKILWKDWPLAEDDERFWDKTRSQVPSWAFFRRKTISADDQLAQEEADRGADECYQVFFYDADELTITEKDGVQTLCARFKVNKESPAIEKKESWWQRIFRKVRLPKR